MLVNGWTVGHCTTCLNQATETLETATVIIDREIFFKKSPSLCLALACSGSTLLVAQSRLPELDSSTSADPATRSRMSKNCCGECPHMWTFARQNGEPHHATEQRFHEKITSQTTRIITFLNPAKSGGTIPPGCFACNFDRQGLESYCTWEEEGRKEKHG